MLVDGCQQVLSVGEDGKAAANLLHGLFLQLGLGQSRDVLVLTTTGGGSDSSSDQLHHNSTIQGCFI